MRKLDGLQPILKLGGYNIMTKTWPNKDPDERKDYDIDWTPKLLLFGETVPSDLINNTIPSKWKIEGDGMLVKDSQQDGTTLTKIWLPGGLGGGTVGQQYRLTNRVTTIAGRILEESGVLTIKSRGFDGTIP